MIACAGPIDCGFRNLPQYMQQQVLALGEELVRRGHVTYLSLFYGGKVAKALSCSEIASNRSVQI